MLNFNAKIVKIIGLLPVLSLQRRLLSKEHNDFFNKDNFAHNQFLIGKIKYKLQIITMDILEV